MGVKQTTDVLEKGTWIFAAIIAILCVVSTVFIPGSHAPRVQAPSTNNAPASQVPATGPTAPAK